MKKKYMKWSILVITLILFTGCSSNQSISEVETGTPICKVEGCNNPCKDIGTDYLLYVYYDYCVEHACEEDGCGSEKESSEKYCTIHKKKHALEERNSIKLSDSQVKQARKVVDEYCDNLLSKHSNILAVNIINDRPETTPTSILFDCNVVREDSDVNLATIYVSLQENGSFKFDRL